MPILDRTSTLARATIAGAAMAAAFTAASPASAQNYPTNPVQIIVPFAPGGPTDIMARIIAGPLGDSLGQAVVVENRAGAGGNIGIGAAAQAEPDGYTLLITSSAYVVNPGLYPEVPYDALTSFDYIAMLGSSPNIFVAHPDSGIESIEDVVELGKADPDALDYASPGAGTTPHLAAELLKIEAGIDMVHVPFGGAGPALQAILAQQTRLASTALPPVHPQIQQGALVGLAVTGRERWHDLPDIPTMVELGYDDFVSETFQAFMAPAGTPPEIVERLSTEVLAVLEMPEIRERLQQAGFGVVAEGPEEMREQIEREVRQWADLVEQAGIAVD